MPDGDAGAVGVSGGGLIEGLPEGLWVGLSVCVGVSVGVDVGVTAALGVTVTLTVVVVLELHPVMATAVTAAPPMIPQMTFPLPIWTLPSHIDRYLLAACRFRLVPAVNIWPFPARWRGLDGSSVVRIPAAVPREVP